MSEYLYKNENFKIVGLCMEIHRILGSGLLEVVYKDALEFELKQHGIPYAREKEFAVQYKGVILPHKFYADFVVHDDIILEVKALNEITKEHIAQTMNYIKLTKGKLGLIVNFGTTSLQHKRIII
jgi:GxxExxY protein